MEKQPLSGGPAAVPNSTETPEVTFPPPMLLRRPEVSPSIELWRREGKIKATRHSPPNVSKRGEGAILSHVGAIYKWRRTISEDGGVVERSFPGWTLAWDLNVVGNAAG